MPDYENHKLRRFWGYSPEDIVKGLALVIEPHWKKQSQVILVGHDWGSYICMLYLIAYPDTVHKFVTLDIGLRDTLDLVSVSYMTYLAFVFLISRILPDPLALLLFALYPWKAIGPCPYEVTTFVKKHKLYFDVMVVCFLTAFLLSLFVNFRTFHQDRNSFQRQGNKSIYVLSILSNHQLNYFWWK
jgi:pimeloyl-ACP methyl ester carboxylesterase